MIDISAAQLCQGTGCVNSTAKKWAKPITDACNEFGIESNAEIAAFVANLAHESVLFTRVEENLYYKAEQLMKVWPTRFPTLEFAKQYEKQPEKIANLVYANRMGNGGPETGDGWRHRGFGLKQVTGKDNQFAAAMHFNVDPDCIGEWLRTFEGAARSAALFWIQNRLKRFADAGNFQAVCGAINCGNPNVSPAKIVGYVERCKLWASCKKVWP